MSNSESRPKAEKPGAPPPPYSGTGSLDFTRMPPAPSPATDESPVVAPPRKKTASGARKKPGVFPGGAGSVLAVIAIAVVVALATTQRYSETPVTLPPVAAPSAPRERLLAIPESSPAQAPPAAAAPQPAQKRAWPADFLAAYQEYAGKSGSKAMALALDGEGRMAYVGVFEYATQSQANNEALSQCMRYKTQSGVQENCRLYAVGDEIVW